MILILLLNIWNIQIVVINPNGGEPLPCWIKYESESKELSIKFEYEQEGKPNTYVWFKGIVDMLTYPCSVELRSNKPNVTEESMLLEITNYLKT